MKELKVEKWIKAGYKVLSKEGLEGVKVERIAHLLRLNKSGFYHYFGSMKNYIKSLMKYHVHLAQDIGEEVNNCKNIDPDLLHVVVRYKEFFLVQSQGLVKGKPAHSFEDFEEAAKIISRKVLPLWKKVNELPQDSTAAGAYMNIFRDFFYARINSKNINYEFLHKLAAETKAVLNKVVEEKHIFSEKR